MAEIKDFVSPTSMLTPGIAGGLTATVAMPLVVYFDLKYPWVALIISFTISLTIVLAVEEKIKHSLRCLYCILNTLIIFSVSVGAGVSVNPPPDPSFVTGMKKPENQTPSTVSKALSKVTSSFFMSNAHAQQAGIPEDEYAGQPAEDRVSTGPASTSVEPADRTSDSGVPRASDRDQEEKYQEALKIYHRRWTF